MRNYFSQLAKQSGLHSPGQSGKTRSVKSRTEEPLEQENTILVAPDFLSEQASVKTAEIPSTDSPKPVEKNPPPVAKSAETTVESVETVFVESPPAEKNGTEKTFSDETIIETVVQSRTENLPEISLSESPTVAPPSIEEIVFKDAATPADTDFSGASTFEATTGNAPPTSDISETKQSSPPQSAPQYFKKTGEMLEKGEPNRLEIQQILLREVQEWAADTPDFVETETEIVEAQEPRAELPSPLTEEKFVFRETDAEPPGKAQGLEEQNFNLSIGAISIVIEEAEKMPPPENATPNTPDKSETTETKRQFSRLSRNYL